MVSFVSETKIGVAAVIRVMAPDRAWAMWTIADEPCVRDLSTLVLASADADRDTCVIYMTSFRNENGHGHVTVESWDRGRVLSEYVHLSSDLDGDVDRVLAHLHSASMRVGPASERLAKCVSRVDGFPVVDIASLFEWAVSK